MALKVEKCSVYSNFSNSTIPCDIIFCRRSNTTLTSTLRPNKMGENVHPNPNMVNGASKRKAPIPTSTQQSTTRLRIPAPPPPLPVKRRIGEVATDGQSPKKDGQNGSKLHLGGKVEGKGGQQAFNHPTHSIPLFRLIPSCSPVKCDYKYQIRPLPLKIRLSSKNERA